jgi:hypothetical protein
MPRGGGARRRSRARRGRSPGRCAGWSRRGAAPRRPRSRRPPRPGGRRRARRGPPRCGHRLLHQRAGGVAAELRLQRRDLLGRRAGGDDDGARGIRACPPSRPAPARPAPRHPASRARRAPAPAHGRARSRSARAWRASRSPATTAQSPCRGRAAPRVAALRQQAGAAEILRQAHRDARSAGDQRVAGAGLADREQVRVADGIHDGVAPAGSVSRVIALPDRGGALLDRGEGHEPDPPSVWRDSTRTRFGSFIGVSGWFSIPLSLSSAPDEEMPW